MMPFDQLMTFKLHFQSGLLFPFISFIPHLILFEILLFVVEEFSSSSSSTITSKQLAVRLSLSLPYKNKRLLTICALSDIHSGINTTTFQLSLASTYLLHCAKLHTSYLICWTTVCRPYSLFGLLLCVR